MSKNSVLIVDDDELFSRILKHQLLLSRYECSVIHSGDELHERLCGKQLPDVILLDYSLGEGKKSGLDLCRSIKSHFNVPIIMVTANSSTETIVSCLDAGADQYIVKPYVLNELLARIRSTMRNYKSNCAAVASAKLECDGFLLDSISQTLSWGGTQISLTDKELVVLELFFGQVGSILTREYLYRVVHEREFDAVSRSIDILVGRLRNKICGAKLPLVIKAVRGIGYMCYAENLENAVGGERTSG